MRAKINPTGTHVKNGFLKVRIDLYPDPADKTYALHYVEHFDREPTEEELTDPEKLARVPVHRELNPCFCHFITVPEDITGDQLLAYVERLFTPDCLATLDDALVLPDAIHYVSPYMRSRPKMAAHVIRGKAEDVMAAVNERLSGLEFSGDKGKPESIEPESIDVGYGASALGSNGSANYVRLDLNNPANATGTLDTSQVYANSDLGGFKYAACYLVSGTTYECRDVETIGSVSSGSVQTFDGLDIDVEASDYNAGYWSSGTLATSTTLGVGTRVGASSGDYLTEDTQFGTSSSSNKALALYGTGTEGGGVTEKTSAETGAGLESVFGRGMARGETGSGAESLGPRVFGLTDAGSGVEGVLARAALLAGDAGQAAEYAHILGLWEVLFGGDAGRGSDSLKGLAVTGGHDTGLRAGPGRVGIPHKEVKL